MGYATGHRKIPRTLCVYPLAWPMYFTFFCYLFRLRRASGRWLVPVDHLLVATTAFSRLVYNNPRCPLVDITDLYSMYTRCQIRAVQDS